MGVAIPKDQSPAGTTTNVSPLPDPPAPAPSAPDEVQDTFVFASPTPAGHAYAAFEPNRALPTVTSHHIAVEWMIVFVEALAELFSGSLYHSSTWNVREELQAIGVKLGRENGAAISRAGLGTYEALFAHALQMLRRAHAEAQKEVSEEELQKLSAWLTAGLLEGVEHETSLSLAFPALMRNAVKKTEMPAITRLPTAAASAHPTHLPLAALDSVAGAKTTAGQMFELDGTSLGDRRLGGSQRVSLRAIHRPQQGDGYELNFDLRDRRDAERLQALLAHKGATRGDFMLQQMTFTDGRFVLDPTKTKGMEHGANRTVTLEKTGAYQIDVMDGAHEEQTRSIAAGALYGQGHRSAVLGKVRIRVYGEGATLAARTKEVVDVAKLGPFLADGTPEGRDKLDRLALLSHRAPPLAEAFYARDLEKVSLDEIDRALVAVGLDPRAVRRFEPVEVFPGYVTNVDPQQGEEYSRLGVSHLYHQVSAEQHLPKILGADGLMSTEERFTRGIFVVGMSSQADVETGGADSVFCRFALKGSEAFYSSVSLIYGTDALDRMDWYAYPSDLYGSTAPESYLNRKYGAALVASLRQGAYNNEVMFRRGLSVKYLQAVRVQSYDDKARIVKLLRDAGVTEINGRNVEDVVEVRKLIDDAAHERYLRQVVTEPLNGRDLQRAYERPMWRDSVIARWSRLQKEVDHDAMTKRMEAMRALSDEELSALVPVLEAKEAEKALRERMIFEISLHGQLHVKVLETLKDAPMTELQKRHREVLLAHLQTVAKQDGSALSDEDLAKAVKALQEPKLAPPATSVAASAALLVQERRAAMKHRLEQAGIATKGMTDEQLLKLDTELEEQRSIADAVGFTPKKDLPSEYAARQRQRIEDHFPGARDLDKLGQWQFRHVSELLLDPAARTRANIERLKEIPADMRLRIVAAMVPKNSNFETAPGMALLAQMSGLDKGALIRAVKEH